MPVMRIYKKYNRLSKLKGIVQTDTIKFETKKDGLDFCKAIVEQNKKGTLEWDLLDYEWLLTNPATGSEILENPTGGFTGHIP